jgi:hypothetical protein
MTKENHICCRCKKKEAIKGILLPVREEKFWLCKDCLLLVMELLLRWLETPKWDKVLWEFERKLR